MQVSKDTGSGHFFSTTPAIVIHNDEVGRLLKDQYTADDVNALWSLLKSKGSLNFPTIPNCGLFSAAVEEEGSPHYTGYSNVWVRDNIHVAHAQLIMGEKEKATRVIKDLVKFWAVHDRFTGCITGQADTEDVMQRPHIRFNGHGLQENKEHWSHAQNDALGYFLWLACKLGRDDPSLLTDDMTQLTVLLVFYLYTIGFWSDRDNGHWEEARKVEASSVGAVTAGLRELHLLLQGNETFAAAFSAAYEAVLDPNSEKGLLPKIRDDLPLHKSGAAMVEAMEAKGHEALDAILPYESRDEGATRTTDGALIFLVYPLNIVKGPVAKQIVRDVVDQLGGDFGIRRYRGDSYWMADYKSLFSEETRTTDFSEHMADRDRLLKPGEEAQWCLFDSIVSSVFGMWLAEEQDEGMRVVLRKNQVLFFNRAMGQITGTDCAFGPFHCPESYYLEKGRYVVNDVCPLLWTQANLIAAMHLMLKTVGA